MLWIFARVMNLALTGAALGAGIVVSGGISRTSWAKLATNDVDLGSLNALAETNSLTGAGAVIWAWLQPATERAMAFLQSVKEDEGAQVAGILNRQLESMQDAFYAGDYLGLALPVATALGGIVALRFVLRIVLRKPRRAKTGRSDFQFT